jgi:hypothetical protein
MYKMLELLNNLKEFCCSKTPYFMNNERFVDRGKSRIKVEIIPFYL